MSYYWILFFYYLNRIAPARFLTSLFGFIAKIEYPCIKNFLINSFIKNFTIDMSCVKNQDISSYKNFNEFFTRELNSSSYFIDANPLSLVAPAQSVASNSFSIDSKMKIDYKDFIFDINKIIPIEFQKKAAVARIFYLSPRDYHRVHSPVAGKIVYINHYKNKLLSVNPSLLQVYPQLLEENDQSTIIIESEFGYVSVILVGAMIVGSIQLNDSCHLGSFINKGAELGYFELGSTVILITPDNFNYHDHSAAVQVGMQLGFFKKE